jgi:hypothetical protein
MNVDRFRDLTATIEQLTESLRNLEARVFHLENRQPTDIVAVSHEPLAEFEAGPPGEDFGFTRPSATRVFFLLRALTDGGTLPPLIGFALGLAYALVINRPRG